MDRLYGLVGARSGTIRASKISSTAQLTDHPIHWSRERAVVASLTNTSDEKPSREEEKSFGGGRCGGPLEIENVEQPHHHQARQQGKAGS